MQAKAYSIFVLPEVHRLINGCLPRANISTLAGWIAQD